MDSQALYNQIQSIKGRGREILSGDPEVNTALDELYQAVYHERIKRGCRDCSMVAYGRLIRLNPQQIKIMSERKFKLKPGKAIQLKFGSSEMVSNDNLTDQMAIKLLRQRPYLVREFADYPKNAKGELELPAAKNAPSADSGKKGGKGKNSPAKGKAAAAPSADSGKKEEGPAEEGRDTEPSGSAPVDGTQENQDQDGKE